MKSLKITLCIVILLLSIFQLNAQNDNLLEWATQGSVKNQNFESEIPFRYIDGYIFIDIVQNGKTFNFFFDTGAEATIIDKSILNEFNFKPFAETNMSGPLITDQKVSTIVVSSILLSNIIFTNIGAVAIDLKFTKAKFCEKVHGIIGSTLLKKAKWQIDYKNKLIRITDNVKNFKLGDSIYTLKTQLPSKGWGTEKIEMNIDGEISLFNFDTGNGRSKIVTHPRNFKKYIKHHKNSIIEYGFKKSETDYKFIAKTISVGNLELKDQAISLENEIGDLQLLGNRFYENFLVTIDWENHHLFLEPIKAMSSDTLVDFEIKFKPNFEKNTIKVATGLKTFLRKNNIENGTVLLKVNESDISNLSHKEFCEFWRVKWPQLITEKHLSIVLSKNGKPKEILLTKKNPT